MQDYLNFHVDLNAPEVVSTLDELSLWSSLFGSMLIKHVPLGRNLTVLDVGCGTGFPILELAQRLGSTSTVYGLDPWEAALERVRFKARLWNVRNIEIRAGTAEAMPFPGDYFDLIVSNLGVNNVHDLEAAFADCHRVAKPSARLALTTNLQGHMAEFYEVFAATLRETAKDKTLPALERHIAHRATVPGLTASLARNGFQVTKVETETAVMRFADGSSLLRHYAISVGFLNGWRDVLDPGDQKEVFAHLEQNLNSKAESRGELSLTIPIAYLEAEKR